MCVEFSLVYLAVVQIAVVEIAPSRTFFVDGRAEISWFSAEWVDNRQETLNLVIYALLRNDIQFISSSHSACRWRNFAQKSRKESNVYRVSSCDLDCC